jgi:hypothetical protein
MEMVNDLTGNGKGTAVSTELLSSLRSGIADSRANTEITGGGGKPLLRLLKSGQWVYGQTDEPVQEGSEWAINPLTVQHGWVCWSDYPGNTKNKRLGAALTPITQKKPGRPIDIDGFPWNDLWVFELACISGEDKGVEVTYNANSGGGKKAADAYLASLQRQIEVDPTRLVAIVQLEAASYQHVKYGQIFNPVLDIVEWVDMDGNRGQPQQAPAEPPRKPPLETTGGPERLGGAPRRQRPVGRV